MSSARTIGRAGIPLGDFSGCASIRGGSATFGFQTAGPSDDVVPSARAVARRVRTSTTTARSIQRRYSESRNGSGDDGLLLLLHRLHDLLEGRDELLLPLLLELLPDRRRLHAQGGHLAEGPP